MNDLSSLGKLIISFALILLLVGGLLYFFGKVPGFKRLPGDIYIKRDNFTFYFPLGASIIISAILTILLNLILLIRR